MAQTSQGCRAKPSSRSGTRGSITSTRRHRGGNLQMHADGHRSQHVPGGTRGRRLSPLSLEIMMNADPALILAEHVCGTSFTQLLRR
jgi:hypothetical protein